jgi:GNAT superfamily N-acetyltransferase
MHQDEIAIRAASVADADVVTAFNIAMAMETEGLKLDVKRALAGARTGLADRDRANYYLCDFGGATIGQLMVTAEWSDWRNGFWWWIQSVYVVPEHRRRGVFRQLYRHVRELAGSRGDVCGLRLYVHKENARAIDTYRMLGMNLTDYLICEEAWSYNRK